MAIADIRARNANIGPQSLEVQYLLLAHLVGNDEDEAIALLCRDKRQAETGIPGGGLDQRAARPELAVALGCLDERQADAVLDRASGILVLEFGEEAAWPGIEPRQLDQRRVADRVEHVAVDHHGASSARRAPRGSFLRPAGEAGKTAGLTRSCRRTGCADRPGAR